MSTGRRIAANARALAASRFITMGLNFAVWVHLARVLGVTDVGLLTFGTALLSYFLLAVTLGLDAVAVREIARLPDRVHGWVPGILGLRLTLAGGTSGLYVVIVTLLPTSSTEYAVLLLLGVQLIARGLQIDWLYQGLEKMRPVALRECAAALISASALFVLVREPGHVLPAATALAAGPLLSSIGLLVVYSREYGIPIPHFDRAVWARLIVPALPLALSAFISEIYYSLDKIMLELMRTTREVGLYGVGYKAFALALAPSSIAYPAFYPALSSALGNSARMRIVSEAFARIQMGIGLSVGAAGAILAPEIMNLLFGREYDDGATALSILFLNAAVIYMAMSYGIAMMAWNQQKKYAWAVGVGGGVNVFLNLILIKPFGIEGAALATLASEAAVLIAMASFFKRTSGHVFGPIALRSVLAAIGGAALPAFGLKALGAPFPVTLCGVVLATGTALWAAKLVTRRDLSFILPRSWVAGHAP